MKKAEFIDTMMLFYQDFVNHFFLKNDYACYCNKWFPALHQVSRVSLQSIKRVFIMLCVLTPAHGEIAYEMGIVTGGKTGTYMQIGQDIKQLLQKHDIKLTVHPSEGSMQNIMDVYKRKGIQLGIVQSTYIENASDDEDMKRIAKKIKLIFPLYNEEVHILARDNLQTISDLQGKRVALGREGSGTFLTSSTILDLADIRPKEEYLVGGGMALEALKANKIDAMFYVAGSPVALFDNIKPEDQLNFVKIDDKAVKEHYPDAKVPKSTYVWQQDDLSTVAVKAVLVTYDYKRLNCKRVAKIADLIYTNQIWLRKNGHRKWNHVNLNFSLLRNWQRYACVRGILKLPDSRCDKVNNLIARKRCFDRL